MKKVNKKSYGKSLPALVSMVCVLLLILSLGACSDNTATPTSNAGSSNSQITTATTTGAAAILGDGGAAAANNNGNVVKPLGGLSTTGDPFASYSAAQVMAAFVKAYQQGDWETCNGLIADEVRVGWSSPDQLQLDIEVLNTQKGPIHVITYGFSSDQGSLKYFTVIYFRSKDPNATVPPKNQ